MNLVENHAQTHRPSFCENMGINILPDNDIVIIRTLDVKAKHTPLPSLFLISYFFVICGSTSDVLILTAYHSIRTPLT